MRIPSHAQLALRGCGRLNLAHRGEPLCLGHVQAGRRLRIECVTVAADQMLADKIDVSTDKQGDRGVSLDAQRAKVHAYAELYDLELTEVIVDAGESAKSLPSSHALIRGRCVNAVSNRHQGHDR